MVLLSEFILLFSLINKKYLNYLSYGKCLVLVGICCSWYLLVILFILKCVLFSSVINCLLILLSEIVMGINNGCLCCVFKNSLFN